MKKILNCLKYILFFFLIPTYVFADDFVSEHGDANVSASVNVDNFSSVEISPNTGEIGIEADVLITLLDYLGDPISNHSVRLYIDGDSTGVTLSQPADSDSLGHTTGSIEVLYPGTYKVMAVDNTYGYDITIADFDIFYAVPLDIPSLLSEPYYTKSLQNTVKWVKEIGYEYYIEVSKDSLFDVIVNNSGWVSESQYTFTDLEDGSMYFYRLKKRNTNGGESGWSNSMYSVQDYSAPVITLLSIENINKIAGDSDDFIEIEAKIEDNLSLFSETTYCVLLDGSLYQCASNTALSGSIYTSKIPFSELERDTSKNLLDKYLFCIEAVDDAGNISRNCNIEITLKEETQSNIIEPSDEIFSFDEFILHPLTYLPYTVTDNMVSTMTELEMSITTLITSSLVFFVLLSLYFGNISIPFLYPIYWMFLPLRKAKQYILTGIVYDSFTKEPLKYSLVKIFNKSEKRIGVCMTNDHGEFGVNLNEKSVKVIVLKNGFTFPSSLVTEKSDYPYLNVYTGGSVNFRNSNEAYISIPLDIKEKNYILTKLKSSLNILIYIFFLILFSFSIFLSFFVFSNNMSVLNLILLIFNILDVVLILKLLFEKVRKISLVKNQEGKPISGITVVVKDTKSGKILQKRVTRGDSKYFFDLEEGEYILDILNTDFELIAVEGGREFRISEDGKNFFGRDLIVEKK